MDYVIHRNAVDKFYHNLDIILKELNSNNKIVIFGTNKVSGMMAHYLIKNGKNVYALIDNDTVRQGQRIFGIKVYSPEKCLGEFDDDYRILIVSGHQQSMVKQLTDMGYEHDKHIRIVIDLNQEMSDFSFVDRNGYEELSDEEVRKKQINALRHLKEVCERNHLKYYLAYGTLLGAVRHKGYIPWDDDIDVFVELEDLKRLNQVMKDDKEFSLISFVDEDNDYCDEISLFVDCSAIMDNNHFPIQLTTGITIDVFCLSGIPDGENEFYEYAQKAKQMEQIKWNKMYNAKECKAEVMNVLKFLSQYEFGKTKRVGSILSPYFLREVFDYNSFAHPRELLFEGEYYKAPYDYNEYLCQIYGEDYMLPPPEKERNGHHSYRAYKKY